MSTIARSEAAMIAGLCTDCGVPHMAASLLAEGVTYEQAKDRVAAVGTVRQITALARRQLPTMAANFGEAMLAEGKTVAEIRAAAFEAIVAEEAKTAVSSHAPLNEYSDGRATSMRSMHQTLAQAGMTPKRAGR